MSATRVAVIGVGNMGKNHARVYAELSRCELVAVSDVNEESARQLGQRHHCKHYTDYAEMIEKEELDAVSVCVPTGMHKEVATACIESGLHVLLEKPIAATSEEGMVLRDLAEEKGTILLIGHIERFNPAVRTVKRLLEAGAIGTPVSSIVRRVGLFPPQIKDADVVVDIGIHDIDIVRFLFGHAPELLAAKGGKALNSRRLDYFQAMFRSNGCSCTVEANWITPVKVRNLVVTGTHAYLEMDFLTQQVTLHQAEMQRTYNNFGDFITKFTNPHAVSIEVPSSEPLVEELSHFLRAITEDEPLVITPDEAISALALAEAVSSMAQLQ